MSVEENKSGPQSVTDESTLLEQLVVKDDEALESEVIEPEDSDGRLELVRYDPLRHYLLEISKYEPLSREEEHHLATLFRETQDKDAARRLVTSNLKLVVKIAFLYNKVYA